MGKVSIRMAAKTDAASIRGIYAPYVTNTTITFEYDVPTVQEFESRVQNTLRNYPYIVCTIDDKIAGYAYACKQKERAAYQWNAELSVYLDEKYTGAKIGKALYHGLIEILKLQNIRNVYCVVTMPNTRSQKLHDFFGFKTIGICHDTGFKNGKWHDVLWLEKSIGSCEDKPKAFIPIGSVDGALIQGILEESGHMIDYEKH